MIKLFSIITACWLFTLNTPGQQVVDVGLTSQTNNNCQVTLFPSSDQVSILSSVVFTLRWRSDQSLMVHDPTPNEFITISKSGPIKISGGWAYQTFSGCGIQAKLIDEPININIPLSGKGTLYIAVDSYVDLLAVNGGYYVSVGGQDVTGGVLDSGQRISHQTVEGVTYPIMYYNPLTRQLYSERGGIFYNVVGQEVTLPNVLELITVRKQISQ